MAGDEPLTSAGPDEPLVGAFDSPPAAHPRPRWGLHLALGLATLATSTVMGAIFYAPLPVGFTILPWWRLLLHPEFLVGGLGFSLPLLTILLCHETGHYLAARYHRLDATLPFFIPMPIPFLYSPGTMGAVIRIREPIRRRAQLMDVGAWGPLAGFAALVPVLLLGLSWSTAAPAPHGPGTWQFGEPLVFRVLARGLFFPDLAEGFDLVLHPTAWAAWWGLFVTALNMLPFAQLDGGHVCYALFGAGHRRWARRLLAGLAGLGMFSPVWALWTAILILIGPIHPPVADEEHPLDRRRTILGWLALAVLVVSFAVTPIRPPL